MKTNRVPKEALGQVYSFILKLDNGQPAPASGPISETEQVVPLNRAPLVEVLAEMTLNYLQQQEVAS